MIGARDVVLASMNLHGGRDPDGTPYDVAAACRRLKADVIVLQEAWHANGKPDPAAEVAGELGARLLRAVLLADTDLLSLNIGSGTTRGRWGLAVITTLPVTGYMVVTLGRAPRDVIPRAAQLVTLETPGGGTLRVANTHLTHRWLSPVQLVRLVRILARDEVPTVIAGDLNMPGPVTGLAAGYKPAVTGRTFPSRRPWVQLDHVLTGRGTAGLAGEVLPDLGSDHLPVRVRLHLT